MAPNETQIKHSVDSSEGAEEQSSQRYLRSFVRKAIQSSLRTAPLVLILGVVGFIIGTFLTMWTGPFAAIGGATGMIIGALLGGIAEYQRKKAGRGHFPDDRDKE